MQITLKNVNKIKEGTINLNGLTVIAGVNDSGKSTVGKMLFALTKAIYNIKHYSENRKIRDISLRVYSLYRYFSLAGLNLSALSLPEQPRDFVQLLIGMDNEALPFFKTLEEKIANIEAT